MSRALAAWACAATLLAPAATRAEDGYRALVERYAGGDRYTAVRELGGRPPEALAAAVADTARSIRSQDDPADRERLLKAAVLIHLEQSMLRQRAGQSLEALRHAEFASAYIRLVDGMPAPGVALLSFSRRFYLLQGLLRQAVLDVPKARAAFDEGLKRFPRDAALLLAKGSLEETLVRMGDRAADAAGPASPGPRERGRRRRAHQGALDRTEALLRAALAADPALDEARLHLGRVLQLQERFPEALETLTAAARASDPDLRHLAHLFLGRLHEARGDDGKAVEAFRAAVAAVPPAQTGALALSRALARVGRRGEAQEALDHAVALGGGDSWTVDPWCTYAFGQARETQRVFDQLALELR